MSHDPPRILVVDDEIDICRNLSDILSDLGYHVDTAQDGPAALDLLRQRPYDVALLDYRMPGMDGLTLFREIKKQRAGTVSMLVTAYASPATAEEALTAGAWKVIAKPVDFDSLLALVDEAVCQPMVLVVDDDHELCMSLWDLLRDGGYRVSLAHDGRGAADQLSDTRFKVVLIDLRIPGGDGGDVLRMVRDGNPHARTIVITGHRSGTDAIIDQMLAEGADAVCYKPFDVPALLAKLGELAGTHDEETGNRPH
jgi:CheY-like chemotaxis protein